MTNTNELKNIEPAPDWLHQEVLAFLTRIGFGDWQIEVNICDMPVVDGQLTTWGGTHADSAYLVAMLYFDRKLTMADKTSIYHECLHVVFSELQHCVEQQMLVSLPDEKAAVYRDVYKWHLERLIERLARAFSGETLGR